MKGLSRFRTWWRAVTRREEMNAEVEAELTFHIESYAEDLMRSGLSHDEAMRRARAEFGGIAAQKENCRAAWGTRMWDEMWVDVRYGMRQMRRNPGFALTVIVTLALAVGANTAIFSVVNALMLTKLPYAHPERLGTIFTRVTGPNPYDERHHIDGEQWELLRDDVPALISGISGIRTSGVDLQARGHAQYVHAERISEHYLDVLSIHPLLGRNFSDVEDEPNGVKSVILSYHLWRNTFSADVNVLGKAVLLKGAPYTVIGVLPEGSVTPQNADLYTAIQASSKGEGGGTNFVDIVRLRDGATWQEANAQINRAWAMRTNRYELQDNPGAKVTYYTVPLLKGETTTLRPEALALMLAAGLILLIACANLAGLTLVRVLRRTPEIATRLALGASQWKIQKQLWIENIILALAGGAAGVGVGFVALRGLLSLLPEHLLPVASVPLDGRVLTFTLVVSMLTSVIFGMLPALVTRRFDLRSAIGSRSATGGDRLGLRQALIAGEVALTVVLLAASGLLVRTLVHLETLPPGFNPNGVMTAKASLDSVQYQDADNFRKLMRESTTAMRKIPGVQDAAVGLSLPYERSLIMGGITIGDGKETGQGIMADEVYVTPEYFAALRIPVVEGRAFTDADGPKAQLVAIVNQTFARKFLHGANPIGRYLNKDTRIVGVTADVAMAPGIDASAPMTMEQTMYVPAAQMESQQLAVVHMWFQPSWIVRTAGPVTGLTGEMQKALASVDPNLPFSGFYSMRDLMDKTLAMQRVEVALLSAMALLALLLSMVGIFGLVANLVAQRTREIGIRMALGSSVRQAMVNIGLPGTRAVLLGMGLGLLLCAGSQRAMRSVIYGVGVYDPATIAIVVAVLVLVSVVAVTIPTLRIVGIDPAQTLREE